MTTPALKPCPFCGGEPKVILNTTMYSGMNLVSVGCCGRVIGEEQFSYSRWNHRLIEDAQAERIKRMEEALVKISTTKFLDYENTEFSMYGTGVTDGHRLAAQWARDALEQTEGK